jgi:long-subunit fatty acid transport protein
MTRHWGIYSEPSRKLQSRSFTAATRQRFTFSVKRAFQTGFYAIIVLLFCALPGQAQNLEIGGGYVHVTGDSGLDGFNLGTAWWFTPRVSVAVDYDSVWDNSRIGVFDLTSVGVTTVKSHMQDFLIGPRIFFATKRIKKYKFDPFAEVQFGGTHLSQSIQQISVGTVSASANGFTWLLGGGGDYALSHHWSARANLDFMRTHLSEQGQSRLRLRLGVAYTFGSR